MHTSCAHHNRFTQNLNPLPSSPPRPPNCPPPRPSPLKPPRPHRPNTGPANRRAQRAATRRARQEIRPASVVRARRARVLRAVLPFRGGARPTRGRPRGCDRAYRRECELVERAPPTRERGVGRVARDVRRAALRAGCRSARCDWRVR